MSLLDLSDAHMCDYRTEVHLAAHACLPPMNTEKHKGGVGPLLLLLLFAHVGRFTREGG